MPKFDYQLIVIGAGSGGIRLARRAAKYGITVAVADPTPLGGTCVNRGCIPKKLLVYATHIHDMLTLSDAYGWENAHADFNWQTLIANKDQELQRLNRLYGETLNRAGINLLPHRARLIDGHTVAINNKHYTARNIVIACGSAPRRPNISGKEFIISSDEALSLPSLPKHILIVGGGYIAVEFAGIFHRLNVHTTLIHRGELLLKGFDNELSQRLTDSLTQQGISLFLNAEIAKIEKNQTSNSLQAYLNNGVTLTAEQILYAIGRQPATEQLGLQDTGINLNPDGTIKINQYFQTNLPSIYALGDVIGRTQLTPVALAEAEILAKYLSQTDNPKNEPDTIDYGKIPTCIFSHPPVASVGMTEAVARLYDPNIEVYHARFTPLRYALADYKIPAFIKLISAPNQGKILGAHMIGDDAGEIIQGIAIAIQAGATKTDFDQTIGIHPTSAEEFVSLTQAH